MLLLLTIPACGSNDASLEKFDSYNLKKCDSNCVGEEAEHIDPRDRASFLLVIRDGKFYDSQDSLVDSSGIYVMSGSGEIYYEALLTGQDRSFFHSRFLGGRAVAGAGWMVFKQGVIQLIDNASGHYKPDATFLFQVVRELALQGADLSQMEVRVH